MRHIRNAFAHGLIKKEGKNFTFQDYSTIGTQTMGGHIRCDLICAMLDILKQTKLKISSTYEKTIILTHVWLIAIWLWR